MYVMAERFMSLIFNQIWRVGLQPSYLWTAASPLLLQYFIQICPTLFREIHNMDFI